MPRPFVEPVYASPVDQCDWTDCRQRPTYRVTQLAEHTGDEIGQARFFCDAHAALVETLTDEAAHRPGASGGVPL